MIHLLPLLAGLFTTDVSANIGYFWHITDLHWDTSYFNSNCRRRNSEIIPAIFGDHNCDSPWNLIESAVQFMYKTHGDNIEFVLWTGDGLAHSKSHSLQSKVAALQNITHLLSQAFSSQFVFPVLGHDDVDSDFNQNLSYQQLSTLWKHWLPSEALHTFNKGGFYTIEQKERKLRLIALNTNLFVEEDENPAGQWTWLEDILQLSKKHKETVYIVGHMPPGVDERQGTPPIHTMAANHNARFVSLVKTYADIINGQFFGHLHSDTFRVIYNDSGSPVSCIFVAPSVTPKRTSSGINNPGLRLYKFHTDTGQIMDYLQYFLDLTAANQGQVANWELEYSLTEYYGFSRVSPLKLHQLVESFKVPEGYTLFRRYYLANSVRSNVDHETLFNAGTQNIQYCAITNVELPGFHDCLASRTLALSASDSSVMYSPSSLVISLIVYITNHIQSTLTN